MPIIKTTDLPQIVSESDTSSTSIPLTVAAKSEFAAWLSQQDSITQNWLRSIDYNGTGAAQIPDSAGALKQAIYFSDSDDQFAFGDISSAFPAGTYHMQSDNAATLESAALGWLMGGYKFSAFKTQAPTPASQLIINDQEIIAKVTKIARGVYWTRDLVNTPADSMMPQHLATVMKSLADEFSGQFSEVVGDDLLSQNFPTIHAVGRASVHPPRLLELTWGDNSHPAITLVGKGVCFDSGGLDLKPSSAMRLMKKDMGGAAHAIGLAFLIMAFNLPVRLTLLVPAVENAVSGNAFRPGDVIVTRKGLSVEIDNTDAEGRLVLCDALALACDDQPELLIDFATLTGAARVALGTELPAMFSTSDTIAAELTALGETVTDPLWRLPLHKPYRSLLKSDVADLLNCATSPFGGAITAALYLQEFVDEDVDWLHFDVMAWNNRKLPGRPVGGEAMGIRTLFSYLQQRFN